MAKNTIKVEIGTCYGWKTDNTQLRSRIGTFAVRVLDKHTPINSVDIYFRYKVESLQTGEIFEAIGDDLWSFETCVKKLEYLNSHKDLQLFKCYTDRTVNKEIEILTEVVTSIRNESINLLLKDINAFTDIYTFKQYMKMLQTPLRDSISIRLNYIASFIIEESNEINRKYFNEDETDCIIDRGTVLKTLITIFLNYLTSCNLSVNCDITSTPNRFSIVETDAKCTTSSRPRFNGQVQHAHQPGYQFIKMPSYLRSEVLDDLIRAPWNTITNKGDGDTCNPNINNVINKLTQSISDSKPEVPNEKGVLDTNEYPLMRCVDCKARKFTQYVDLNSCRCAKVPELKPINREANTSGIIAAMRRCNKDTLIIFDEPVMMASTIEKLCGRDYSLEIVVGDPENSIPIEHQLFSVSSELRKELINQILKRKNKECKKEAAPESTEKIDK